MSNIDPCTMADLFRIMVHVVLTAAAVLQLLLIFVVIFKFRTETGWQEIVMRSAAAVAGLLLYLGAKALGLSVPAFLLEALAEAGRYTTGIVGTLLPALVGFLVAWYVNGYFSSRDARRNLVGMRVLSLTMTVVFLLYLDTYIALVDPTHPEQFKLLLPNLVFTLAVLLFAVFRYMPPADERPASASHIETGEAEAP